MSQESLLSRGPDSADIVQGRLSHPLRALSPMGCNGKPVGLIAQTLQKVENGMVGGQHERRLTGDMELLAPRIALGTFRDRRNCNVVNSQIGQNL